MEVIGLITVLVVVVMPCGLPCFETVCAIILFLPAIFYLVAKLAASAHLLIPGGISVFCWMSLVALVFLAYLLGYRYRRDHRQFESSDDIVSLLLFIGSFLICYRLCLLWPDFYPVGERLRDYAVLSSVVADPLAPREFWLAGTPLHYYIYGYLLGAVFSTLFTISPWELYNTLIAFSLALYLSCIFLFFKRHLRFSFITSLAGAVIIACGSNVVGIYEAFTLHVQTQWWSASRVIPGTINEFPVWSFVLGDLHPHYMNLPFLPFAVTVFATSQHYIAGRGPAYYILNILAFVVLPVFYAWNSNPWDAPAWVCFTGVFIVLTIYQYQVLPAKQGKTIQKRPYSFLFTLVTASFLVLLCGSFFLMGQTAPSTDYSIGIVNASVGWTRLTDLFRHWGIPLSLVSICLLYLSNRRLIGYLFLFCTITSACLNVALYFLVGLWAFSVLWFIESVSSDGDWSTDVPVIIEAMGIGAITLLIIPELLFLDDPYRQPYERMNTIFKLYSFTWFPMHAFAIYLVSKACRKIREFIVCPLGLTRLVLFSALIAMAAFFIQSIGYRKMPFLATMTTERGLGNVNATFPGAAKAIEFLAHMPLGSVLEGQGPAYSYTTHVATLASQPAYLGWINHLFLLSPYHEEIQHRIKVTKTMYSAATPCRQRRQTMVNDQIAYLVWGPLEEKQYGLLSDKSFACLERLYQEGSYAIYGPGSND